MKVKNIFCLFCVFGIAFSPMIAFSEEVNDYHPESVPEKQTLDEVNRLINDELNSLEHKLNVMQKGNAKKDCDLSFLKNQAVDYLDTNFTRIGNSLRDINNDAPSKKKYKINVLVDGKKENEIYKDTGVMGCCVSSVNIKGVVLGIDKIDHFFGNGGFIYKQFLDNPSLTHKEIIRMSVKQENGFWGLVGENIKSYGDLVANWEGFKFYRELFDGTRPYFKCKNGVIKKNRSFQIEKYVNVGWSETVNCPAFPSKAAAVIFSNNLKALDLKCPSNVNKCEELVNIYKDQLDLLFNIVSPVCTFKIGMEDAVETPDGTDWTDIKNAVKGIRAKDVFHFLKKGAR